jgi:cell division protein FtsB
MMNFQTREILLLLFIFLFFVTLVIIGVFLLRWLLRRTKTSVSLEKEQQEKLEALEKRIETLENEVGHGT